MYKSIFKKEREEKKGDLDSMNWMSNAVLKKIEWEKTPLELLRWIERQANNDTGAVCNPAYFGVFTGKDPEEDIYTVASAGRLGGFRVWVSRQAVCGQIDFCGAVVFEETDIEGAPFSTVPFEQIFSCCHRLYNQVKAFIPEQHVSVPWLGGVKSILLKEESQIAVDFYLPELSVFGKKEDWRLFEREGLSCELDGVLDEKYFPTQVKAKSIRYYPDKQTYVKRLDKVIRRLKSREIDKIIIARQCVIEGNESLSWTEYASWLYEKYFQEYFYCFRQGDKNVWCSISPSVLFKQHDGAAECRVLAGSRKHYASEEKNAHMRKELQEDPKDREEHECALAYVLAQWSQSHIGRAQITKRREIMETPYTFHLLSEVKVPVETNVSCFRCMKVLYPSPSVWGIPKEAVEETLKSAETFEREYYGGVYGYFNFRGDADFSIVIRAAKVQENRLSVYGGGGIISASDAESEYEETVGKMYPLVAWFSNIDNDGHIVPEKGQEKCTAQTTKNTTRI